MSSKIVDLLGRRNSGIALLVIMVSAFVYLMILPVDYFDEGQSICLSVLLADTKCYACGMTRGIQHLIHGDFAGAWSYNKLSFLVFPLAVALIAQSIFQLIFKKEKSEGQRDKLI